MLLFVEDFGEGGLNFMMVLPDVEDLVVDAQKGRWETRWERVGDCNSGIYSDESKALEKEFMWECWVGD